MAFAKVQFSISRSFSGPSGRYCRYFIDDDVSTSEKTARFLELEETQHRLQQKIYESYLGREIKVLVERPSSKSDQDMSGHSSCHKVVNFPGGSAALGDVVTVRVTEAKPNSLYGQVTSAF